MNEVRRAVEYIYEMDPLIEAYVGRDSDGEVKFYNLVAKSNVEPPFAVWQIIDGPISEGHFGDLHAIEPVDVQVTCWGRNANEAWALFGTAINPAFEDAQVDVELTPYKLMHVRRVGGPNENMEPETRWVSVPSVYRFAIGR